MARAAHAHGVEVPPLPDNALYNALVAMAEGDEDEEEMLLEGGEALWPTFAAVWLHGLEVPELTKWFRHWRLMKLCVTDRVLCKPDVYDLGVAQQLIRRADFDKEAKYGVYTALHTAALSGWLPIIEELLDMGAAASGITDDGPWALTTAAVNSLTMAQWRVLLARPDMSRQVMEGDGDGANAMDAAAACGDLDLLWLFLQHVPALHDSTDSAYERLGWLLGGELGTHLDARKVVVEYILNLTVEDSWYPELLGLILSDPDFGLIEDEAELARRVETRLRELTCAVA